MKTELRLTDENTARDENFIAQVRAVLDLPADARVELQNIAADARGGWNVEYAITLPIQIRGGEFGIANGVIVDERVSAALVFDARGALVSSQVSPVDERHLRSVKDQIKKLAATDQIFSAPSGEPIDSTALRAQRKPWQIVADEQGHKRLKRAYIA
ncbi:MAG: hypothetical protein HZC40_19385 [Chloroflexi bacterium]|nr:hypothetical protein [Chloroflexota bacterium]